MRVDFKQSYTFDDVLLIPQYSEILSREDISLHTKLGKLSLNLPVLSANMDTVTEFKMAFAMARNGGAGVLHRFAPIDDQINWVRHCGSNHVPAIISVGVNIDETRRILNKIGSEINAVCVDVAHGDHKLVIDMIQFIRKNFPDLDIIAGNVATGSAALRLARAGANIIKVGIGPGSVCSTRVVTGHGVPQLSAILDVYSSLLINRPGTSIIADGGIRYPGDIVKALAAGADAVMLGSLLAGTDEASGVRIVEDGYAYKTYRGMASYETQSEKRKGRTPRVEGVSARVPYRGPVADTLANLKAGIASGFSYSGARNIQELREIAQFTIITPNVLRENHPHIHHPHKL